MDKKTIYIIRHSEVLKLNGIKNFEEDSQANNEKIILSIDGENEAKDLSKIEELKKLGENRKYTYTVEQLLDENLKNVDGESRKEVNERMTLVINSILKENKYKNIAIISHGAAIKSFLMNWCKLDDEVDLVYDNNIIEINSPSVVKLEFDGMNLYDLKLIKYFSILFCI